MDAGANCPLLNPKLPPISENEHNIHSCFCYMCICGKHACPGDYHLASVCPSNHFKTNYKIYFKKPVLSKVALCRREDHYIKPKGSSENKSISQSSYIPHFIEPEVKGIVEVSKGTPFKFRGNSVYHSEYPNWGVRETELPIMQRNKIKVNDLKGHNQSQYQEAYHSSFNNDKAKFKELANSFKLRNWKSNGLLSPSTDFIGCSSNAKDYAVLPVISHQKPEKRSETRLDSYEPWKGQFISTYHDSYQGEVPVHFIRKRELRIT